MAFEGSFAQLTRLREKLERLPEAIPEIRKEAATELAIVMERQFSEGTDPNGQPWAKLADSSLAKGRTPPPLTASGNMRGKTSVLPTVKGVTVKVPGPASFHQYGTVKMERRQILPESGTTLPPRWQQPLEAIGLKVLKAKLK